MGTNEGLVGQVPYLRRFARACTGTQELGDSCVVAAIERMLANPSDAPVRIALYRNVLAEIDALETRGLTATSSQSETEDKVQRNLAALTPVGRQAFLLVAMEELSIEDTARVLGVSEQDVDGLLEDANQDLAAQIRTDVLIIEDEPLIALDLQQLVQDLGHRVVRVARTEREAVAAAQASRPGLILADIRLADGSSGLDAVNEILPHLSVPVIFVTAFPEKLLTGIKPEPTFLIRKPFRPDALRAVISQALFFDIRRVL
jgi:CheY-like chemotaxis protein